MKYGTNSVPMNGHAYSWLCMIAVYFLLASSALASVPSAPILGTPNDNATGVAVSRQFRWNQVSAATGYKIQIGTDSTFQSNIFFSGTNVSVADTIATVNAMNISTVYFWRVCAFNGEGDGAWSVRKKFTTAAGINPALPILASPANQATNISQYTTLTWNAVTSASYYAIVVSNNALFTTTICAGTTASTSFQTYNLMANTTYYWYVNALNSYGASGWSAMRSFTTGSNGGGGNGGGGGGSVVLALPNVLSPNNQATGVALNSTLSWQQVTGATHYTVQIATNANFSPVTVNQTAYTTSFSTGYLASGTTYYWRVRANASATTSSWSATRSFTTLVLPAYTGQEVIASHPRLWLDAGTKTKLLARKNANSPEWVALKAQADQLKNYTVLPWTYQTRNNWASNAIFFAYEGYSWLGSTLPLALAYQMTGDTTYSHKLMQLADVMISATNDTNNYTPGNFPPNLCNYAYASRNVLPAAAIIYDWCYDQLGATRKAQMNAMFSRWFDSLRSTNINSYVYQRNGPATGNYFGGHLMGAGLMGLACVGDNPNGQTMVDWARTRFDGSNSSNLIATDFSNTTRVQAFEGGMKPYYSYPYGNPQFSGAPFKGGHNIQGWSYGGAEFSAMIDYLLAVKSATGEDLISAHYSWFADILKSHKESIIPGGNFMIDPFGDYGGNQGAIISHDLAIRLAYIMENTADSSAAQSFAYSELAQNSGYGYYSPGAKVFAPDPWAKFFFYNPQRTQTPSTLVPYYSGFPNSYPQGVNPSGAIPKFIMRQDWSSTATWSSLNMGGAVYDDHQHYNAGHLFISRGKEPVLVSANNWRGGAGQGIIATNGVNGIGYAPYSAAFNTLFCNDFYDYQSNDMTKVGGQGQWGRDEVIAAEQNQNFTYVRSDLSSAYNNFSYPTYVADSVRRSVQKFYRSAVYLRSPNVFITYDQIQMRNSTNANGQYDKHLRWHVVGQPSVNGKSAQSSNGNSKIFIHTLLPTNASISTVDLMNNPDNTWGSASNWAFQSNTWRLEVRNPQNPLQTEYLTVLQPGATSMQEMTTANVATNDALMKGSKIDANGLQAFVLFNTNAGKIPQAISSTSFSYNGNQNAVYMFCGMVPNAAYNISVTNNTLVMQQVSGGAFTASLSGVLLFAPSQFLGKRGDDEAEVAQSVEAEMTLGNYPNPVSERTIVELQSPKTGVVSVKIVNALGQEIAILHEGLLTIGTHQFVFYPNNLPSGIYFLRVESEGKSTTRTMQIIR